MARLESLRKSNVDEYQFSEIQDWHNSQIREEHVDEIYFMACPFSITQLHARVGLSLLALFAL
jgi:hypothetical protein